MHLVDDESFSRPAGPLIGGRAYPPVRHRTALTMLSRDGFSSRTGRSPSLANLRDDVAPLSLPWRRAREGPAVEGPVVRGSRGLKNRMRNAGPPFWPGSELHGTCSPNGRTPSRGGGEARCAHGGTRWQYGSGRPGAARRPANSGSSSWSSPHARAPREWNAARDRGGSTFTHP